MMERLFAELRRRNVFRVAGVYAVIGWLLAQAAGVLENALTMPGWFDTVIVSALLLGFPVALVFAWAFELTPDGVKLTANVPAGESIAPKTGRRLDYAILAGLAAVVIVVIADRLTPERSGASAAAPAAASTEASIAVLPFADLSPARDQEYFADGVSEEILNVLAKAPGLAVASRTSSFAFKGQGTLGVPAIARQLGVRHVLEGSVRKSGGTLRITAQLIDAANDRHLWSEAYDRPLTAENVFAVQDEIARAIVAALSDVMKIDGAPAAAIKVEKATNDLSAYDLYLKARDLYQRRAKIDEAESLLAEAVARDPKFADAWALRAATASLFKEYVVTDLPYEEIGALVDDYADRALALDPDNARAIAARANFRFTAVWSLALKFDIAAGIDDLRRAVALDPRDSSAMNWLGMALFFVGDTEQAVDIFTSCAALDPYFGPCAENRYDVLFAVGRSEEAFSAYQDVLAKGISVGGWANFSLLSERGEKVAFMQAASHPGWLEGFRRQRDLYDAFRAPERDHADLIAEVRAFIRTRPKASINAPSYILLPIGDFDEPPYVLILWSPALTRYRRSPQFKAYIRNTGVYDYWRAHGFPSHCRPVGKDDFECR